jgi:hypothetical protein
MEVGQMREEVERLLQRYADETTTREEGGQQQRSIEVVAGATTQGVRGRPRLLFCGVVAGPFAHGLLLPHEPPPSPVRHGPHFFFFDILFLFLLFILICLIFLFICLIL